MYDLDPGFGETGILIFNPKAGVQNNSPVLWRIRKQLVLQSCLVCVVLIQKAECVLSSQNCVTGQSTVENKEKKNRKKNIMQSSYLRTSKLYCMFILGFGYTKNNHGGPFYTCVHMFVPQSKNSRAMHVSFSIDSGALESMSDQFFPSVLMCL